MCFLCSLIFSGNNSLLQPETPPIWPTTGTSGGAKGDQPSKRRLRLYKFADVSPHLQYNPYIQTGYRSYLSTSECLYSFFQLHNETGNIWTHFLGAILFALASYYTYHFVLPDAIWGQKAIFMIFFAAAICCMVFSTLYHIFLSHSLTVCHYMTTLDYTGIAALAIACFYPPIYFGYYCFPFWQTLYLSLITCFGSTILIGPWFKIWHSAAWDWVRLVLNISVICCGVVPAIHSYFLYQRLAYDMYVWDDYFRIFCMYLVYAVGFVFYITRFPESRFPGKFDYLFHSHQIWHVFVIAGTAVHWLTCLEIYEEWKGLMALPGVPECPMKG